MAQAYVPIQTVTVGSGGASTMTFSSIPQTYTDLVISVSARITPGDTNGNLTVKFNGSSSSYSWKNVYGNGSVAASSGTSTYLNAGYSDTVNQTASTFSSHYIYIPNYTSSNYKSVSIDAVEENNATQSYASLVAGLWSNTAAITQVDITDQGGSFVQYTTATLYGIGGARASGGTITADSRYTYHTFTSSGTFTALEKIQGAEILCVAGGGGAWTGAGGGGGGGGLYYLNGQLLNSGTSYSVIVGSGGAVSSTGADSQFGSLATSKGGGAGGGAAVGGNGGSGGGGGGGTTYAGGTAISGQGNNGGSGGANAYPNDASGGGGGAGAVGSNGSSGGVGGAGGVGSSAYSSWGYAISKGQSSGGLYYFSGGGGGYGRNGGGLGGLGGGGACNSSTGGTAGTANTGGGGGAFQDAGGSSAGGSGIVIVRYPN